MSVLVEIRPEAPREEVPPGIEPPAEGTGGPGGGRPDPLPVWLAVTVASLVAIGLTYLGMLAGIWANMSGAQLPGA
jgi:hypothetical protein